LEELASPETVAQLIAALSKFEPTSIVMAREVFSSASTRVLAVDVDRQDSGTVIITYDVADD
jgi:hypothetical protein